MTTAAEANEKTKLKREKLSSGIASRAILAARRFIDNEIDITAANGDFGKDFSVDELKKFSLPETESDNLERTEENQSKFIDLLFDNLKADGFKVQNFSSPPYRIIIRWDLKASDE